MSIWHQIRSAPLRFDFNLSETIFIISFSVFQFVTHQNCQQVLQRVWTHSHPEIVWVGFWLSLLFFLGHLVMLPFVYIIAFFLPPLTPLTYLDIPVIKYYGDVVSYLVFMAVLLVSIVEVVLVQEDIFV